MKSDNNPIRLNFIWIGDDPAKEPTSATAPSSSVLHLSRIDSEGPMEMCEVLSQQNRIDRYRIVFWCLDEYAPHYQKVFSQYPITVSSIRKSLRHHPMQHSANTVIAFMDELLKPERNRRRDRATIKDLFSLFLLMSVGDYVIDTNVKPIVREDSSSPLKLERYNAFHMPGGHVRAHPFPPTSPDIWMMYSPANDNRAATTAFEDFAQTLQKIELVYAKEGYSENYYNQLSKVVLCVLKTNPAFWTTCGDLPFECEVVDLGVIKYYFNTHTFRTRFTFESDDALTQENRQTYLRFFPEATQKVIFSYLTDEERKIFINRGPTYEIFNRLFLAILVNNTEELKDFIDRKADINQQITTEQCVGLTPLHYAIQNNTTPECMEILLKNGAKTDIPATYKGKPPITAQGLIEEIKDPVKKKTFQNVFYQYHPKPSNSSTPSI